MARSDSPRLAEWVADLRARLAAGQLANLDPIDLGDGTGGLPAERTIRIMFHDLDDVETQFGLAGQHPLIVARRRNLFDDFRRLREVIG